MRPIPPIAKLLAMNPLFPALAQRDALQHLMDELILTVIGSLSKAQAEVDEAKVAAFAEIVRKLAAAFELTFHSLNYDETARRAAASVVGTLEDGFTGVDMKRFDAGRFLKAPGPRFAHLHGSLRFRVPVSDESREQLAGYEVVQFPSEALIPGGFGYFREAYAQADDMIAIGAIVTGLHKADKTLTEPYGTYAYALERDLLATPHLLIIGYGGGDTYLNMRLLRAAT